MSYPKFLQVAVRESKNFKSLLRQLWEQRPSTESSPYNLAVYADEVVPGSVLRLDNRRKLVCIYLAIRDLGPRYLKCEWLWAPVAAIRSAEAKKVPGGISECFRYVVRRLFLHDRVHDHGVVLDIDAPAGRYARFHFRLSNIVADGDALRGIFSSKGASGRLPCMCCLNVLSEQVTSPGLVCIDCPDIDLCKSASNQDIWQKADKLHAAHGSITKTRFEEMQKNYGLTYCPQGLLWDQPLRHHVRPVDVITYDSMHVLVGNGLVQFETACLLAALKSINVSWDHLRRFCDTGWNFCTAIGSRAVLRACFDTAREKAFNSSGSFKATASEMMEAFTVLFCTWSCCLKNSWSHKSSPTMRSVGC